MHEPLFAGETLDRTRRPFICWGLTHHFASSRVTTPLSASPNPPPRALVLPPTPAPFGKPGVAACCVVFFPLFGADLTPEFFFSLGSDFSPRNKRIVALVDPRGPRRHPPFQKQLDSSSPAVRVDFRGAKGVPSCCPGLPRPGQDDVKPADPITP